jgi:hypothetical protein
MRGRAVNVTDGDRERAMQVAERTAYRGRKVLEKAIAAALAEERQKARAQVLALADELDSEAQGRWVRTLEAREAADRDAAFGERGAGDALHDSAVRIRRAAEEGQ